MRILLTNDDGYQAPGIRILYSVLMSRGHEACIIAPKSQRSSTSHSISDCKTSPFVQSDENIFYIDAQPADCIMQSLGYGRLNTRPDAVISGINAGFNLSIDIIYSGTCAAAREAASWGYKSIAISTEADASFQDVAVFLADHLDGFLSVIHPDFFLNINVPKNFIPEWKVSSSLEIHHRDDQGTEQSILARSGDRNSDIAICRQGYISVSAIDVKPYLNKKGSIALKNMKKEKKE